MDLDAEQEKFAAYYKDQTDFPLAKQDRMAEREYGSPWWWRLLALMMADFHLSEREALNMPVMKAALLFSARAEAEGKLKLWTKADDDFEAFCNAMDQGDVQFPEPRNN